MGIMDYISKPIVQVSVPRFVMVLTRATWNAEIPIVVRNMQQIVYTQQMSSVIHITS